jgi:hypothetical protein
MKKTSLGTLIATATLFIFSGCAEPILSNKDAVKSKAYDHTSTIINVPYNKAVSNFKKGLNMCAENLRTPTLRVYGSGGGVRMPGDTYYHVLVNKGKKVEYNLRWFMGGVAEGECSFCQPEGGYYSIYATLERSKGNRAKLQTHTYFKFNTEIQAIEKWVKGDTSSCHGFMGKD